MKKPNVKIVLEKYNPLEGFHHDEPCCRGQVVLKPKRQRDRQGSEHRRKGHSPNCQKPCCRRKLIDMFGAGRKEFPLPAKEKVLQDIAAMIAQGVAGTPADQQSDDDARASLRRRKKAGRPAAFMRNKTKRMKAPEGKGSSSAAGSESHPSASGQAGRSGKQSGHERKLTANANATRVTAELVRLHFWAERWTAAVARKFNPKLNSLRRSRKYDEREKPVIDSLYHEFSKLRDFYRSLLPQTFSLLKMQFPEAGDSQLRAAAVALLDQQEDLAQILYVLDHYVMACEQREDPDYASLQAVKITVEEAFNLFLTGDIAAARGKARQALAETVNFTTDNLFWVRAGEEGPATIPGASGPIGLHLLLVPEDEVGIIMLMIVLYLHEFRHDILADIMDLEEEEAMAVVAAIKDAHASGRLKLSCQTITLGKTTVPLVDLLCKLFLDNLAEIDADLVGGVEMCGWAFALNMLYVFGAFNSKKEGAVRTRELLRTSSYFRVSKKRELWFESHPVDYFRIYLIAEALDLLGFSDEASQLRELADASVGSKKPEFLVWEDENGRRKPIKILMSDLLQVAPVVAEALLMTPFKALKGKSNHDIVAWTPKRQGKVDALVQLLLSHVKALNAGEKPELTLPAGMGDIYATYVASAAAVAFYQLICEGEINPSDVPDLVNSSCLQMLSLCMQRLRARQNAAGDPQPAPAGQAQLQPEPQA